MCLHDISTFDIRNTYHFEPFTVTGNGRIFDIGSQISQAECDSIVEIRLIKGNLYMHSDKF